MNSSTGEVALAAVDKPLAQPYLCKIQVNGDSAYFAAFLAVEPWSAEFPLI